MGVLLDAVVRLLVEDGWPLTPVGEGVFETFVHGDRSSWAAVIEVDEPGATLLVYAINPVEPAPERRVALAEYAHRINWGLATATLEVNFEAGTSRLRSAVDAEALIEAGADQEQLMALASGVLYANVAVMDEIMGPMLDVILGAATPAEAAARLGQ